MEIIKYKLINKKTDTTHKIHYPDVDRLYYVKMKEIGTGLLQTEATYKSEIINIAEYLATKYKETHLKKNI